MPRFFWIALAAGYVLGLAGAAFVLPPSFLIPILGHMAAIALISTALLGVYLLRRQREGALPEGHVMNFDSLRLVARRIASELMGIIGMSGDGRTTVDALDMRDWQPHRHAGHHPSAIVAQDREPFRSLAKLTDAAFDDMPEDREVVSGKPARTAAASRVPAGIEGSPATRHSEIRTRKKGDTTRSRVAAGKAEPAERPAAGGARSGLRCIASPLVIVPQRRWNGLHVEGRLATSPKRSVGRAQLIRHKVPKDQLHRFDAAVLQRAVAMMETHAADLIDRELIAEASLAALGDGALLHRLDRLAADPLTGAVELVIVVGMDEARRLLPKLPALPQNLRIGIRTDDPGEIDVPWIVRNKVARVAMPSLSLRGRDAVPLSRDPLNHRLASLDDAGIPIIALDVDEERSLLDALDYPVTRATGMLFGRRSAVMSDGSCTFFTFDEGATGPEPSGRKAVRAAVEVD